MFKEVSADQESSIIAASVRKPKGPDFTIRTVTQWMTFQHRMGFCTVPSHYDNVPDTDYTGEKYDKHPTRMIVEIEPYEVCRWCYIKSADMIAREKNLPPTEREQDNGSD